MPPKRGGLLKDIAKGKKLKKAVTVDKSAPVLEKPSSPIGGAGGRGPPPARPGGRGPPGAGRGPPPLSPRAARRSPRGGPPSTPNRRGAPPKPAGRRGPPPRPRGAPSRNTDNKPNDEKPAARGPPPSAPTRGPPPSAPARGPPPLSPRATPPAADKESEGRFEFYAVSAFPSPPAFANKSKTYPSKSTTTLPKPPSARATPAIPSRAPPKAPSRRTPPERPAGRPGRRGPPPRPRGTPARNNSDKKTDDKKPPQPNKRGPPPRPSGRPPATQSAISKLGQASVAASTASESNENNSETLSVEEIEKKLQEAKDQMAEATTNMEFEKCIQLRETIKTLEEQKVQAEEAANAKPDNSAEIARIEGEIERITGEMKAATEAMEFEKCMTLRDELKQLEADKAALE